MAGLMYLTEYTIFNYKQIFWKEFFFGKAIDDFLNKKLKRYNFKYSDANHCSYY